jgi:hypothetical protein
MDEVDEERKSALTPRLNSFLYWAFVVYDVCWGVLAVYD